MKISVFFLRVALIIGLIVTGVAVRPREVTASPEDTPLLGPSWRISWTWSASTVQVGDSFTLRASNKT